MREKDCPDIHRFRLCVLDALKRSCASEIAWTFFLVEVKNECARAFYEEFYFNSFIEDHPAMWIKRKQTELITRDLYRFNIGINYKC